MTRPHQEILQPTDLIELMANPLLEDALPGPRSTLIVDLRAPGGLPVAAVAPTTAWLQAQGVVVIGLKDEAGDTHPLEAGTDVLLAPDDLDKCIHAIERNPAAATILVEVLRKTENLPAADALVIESLAYATLQGGAEHRAWLEAERGRRAARLLPARPDMVLLERRDGHLSVRLNSPDTRNSLSTAMRDALADAFDLVNMDPSIEQVEVSGVGPCFSAGGDLKEFGLATDPASAHRIRMQRMPGRFLLPRRDRYRFHLHGACIGAGIELPAFAGTVLARADARFRLPEVAMGLIPGAGGCVSIPRRIGRQRTAWLALTGNEIDVDRALAWGLVDGVES